MFKYFETIKIVSETEKHLQYNISKEYLDYHQFIEEFHSNNNKKFKIFKTKIPVRTDLIFADMGMQINHAQWF